ncbi:MAG: hypothetical protein ACRDNJ_04070 [Solirubrobacteraceae bacterium]
MQPMAIELRVLRTLLTPEIRIAPGRALMARVVAAGAAGGRGSLSIAGLLLEAELPENVRSGDELRLLVTDVNAERVLLTIAPEPDTTAGAPASPAGAGSQPAAQSQAPAGQVPPGIGWSPPPPVPLPGGGTVQVRERDPGGAAGAAGSHALTVRYDSPALGPVDLSLVLDPDSLHVRVTVSPRALTPARAGAGELRQTLATELERGVSVTVAARREPLDVYA